MLPLIYVTNKELIDEHLKNASDVVEAQTSQIRSAAQKQTEHITTLGKQYAGDYTGKVQEMLRGTSSAAPVAAPLEKKEKKSEPAPETVPEPAPVEEEKQPEPVSEPAPVEKEKEPEFPSPPTEEPKKVADLDAPDVPEEPVVSNQEEPLIS